MIAEKEKNKLLNKEEALFRYINQISNIIHSYNSEDSTMMIQRIKESAKRVGILEELEKRIKSLSLVKK